MGDKTGIGWTEATWNPVTGCDAVSAGCDHCYAESIATRFAGTKAYPDGFKVTLRPERLDQPLRWKRSRMVFVNSMSDLFHKDIPDEYIAKVFAVMAAAPEHTFQVLTKRHARMRTLVGSDDFRQAVKDEYARMQLAGGLAEGGLMRGRPLVPNYWPLRNVWLGVSAEDQQWANLRVPDLLGTPAAVRFVSAEPLLGPIDFTRLPFPKWSIPGRKDRADMVLDALGRRYGVPDQWQAGASIGLDWVIVGGESGGSARPMHPDWVDSIIDQCEAAGVALFFKQWGAWASKYEPGDPWADTSPQAWINPEGALYKGTPLELAAIGPKWTGVWKVGAKAAGNRVRGKTIEQFPTRQETPA